MPELEGFALMYGRRGCFMCPQVRGHQMERELCISGKGCDERDLRVPQSGVCVCVCARVSDRARASRRESDRESNQEREQASGKGERAQSV